MPLQQLQSKVEDALKEISEATNEEAARGVLSRSISSKGWISDFLKRIKEVPAENKREFGQMVNAAKVKIQTAFDSKLLELKEVTTTEMSYTDLSLQGARALSGRFHPTTHSLRRICEIFVAMGFEVVDGPEIEDEYHNFDALNISQDHPARDNMDTFFINGDVILRTHTSPVQIRTIKYATQADDVLIRMISPGVTYRRDRPDRTHTPVFSQVEGLVISRNISFSHMAGLLQTFASEFFGSGIVLRLRPDFFPFVEPGAEAAVTCPICRGNGCPTCKRTGWVEIMGCGMVHPQILERQGIPSNKYQGFAFGMGIERITQMLFQIEDSRWFFENDVRFLEQFH